MTNTIYKPGSTVDLKCPRTGRDIVHLPAKDEIQAINLALSIRRPLLVRGAPGVGKSQLARAAAEKLGWEFLPHVVDGRTESRDLLYGMDLVRRLADAHIAALPNEEKPMGYKPGLPLEEYVLHGPIWKALNGGQLPDDYEDAKMQRCVLLIDEIDKADPSVPNGLLGVLNDGWFDVPEIGRIKGTPEKSPLVIITSNSERSLPEAFLRRCVVLTMPFPDKETLEKRGQECFKNLHKEHENIISEVAGELIKTRTKLKGQRRYVPGQAEFFDLLMALEEVSDPTAELAALKGFILDKSKDF